MGTTNPYISGHQSQSSNFARNWMLFWLQTAHHKGLHLLCLFLRFIISDSPTSVFHRTKPVTILHLETSFSQIAFYFSPFFSIAV